MGEENDEIEEDEEGRVPPHQAMMKKMTVPGCFEREWAPLLDLLQVSFLGCLQELSLAVDDEYAITKPDLVPNRLRILTAYIHHTGEAPSLRKLEICLPYTQSSSYLEPLMTVLMQGGAPGLTHLSLSNLNNKGTRFLDKIYQAGGFARLKELKVRIHSFDHRGMRRRMNGVLASSHKGAAPSGHCVRQFSSYRYLGGAE